MCSNAICAVVTLHHQQPPNALKTHPEFIDKVVGEAVRQLRPERVILFGSRARGDAEERSDYDIAIEAPDVTEGQWSRFVLDTKENLDTLLDIDLIRLDQASPWLREAIEREGTVLYAR